MENKKQDVENNGNDDKDDEDLLTLSLASGPTTSREIPLVNQPALLPLPQPLTRLRRRLRSRSPRPHERRSKRRSEDIPAPFPWATNRPAVVHSMEFLQSNHIHIITGDVQCKRCGHKYEMKFHLRSKFYEVASFTAVNRDTMYDRAPPAWMQPALPTCKSCGQENSVKPIISKEKEKINWLFLLLGQMLGCCTLDQLKYFCKQAGIHMTGAKDRLLYLTYHALCKQVDPNGPFDR